MWALREMEAHMYATLSRSLAVKVNPRGWHFEKCHTSNYSEKFMIQYFHFIDLKLHSGNYAREILIDD